MKAKGFAVYLDPGHGGINPKTQQYVTPGKRAFHAGKSLHVGGNYYEGVENRLVCNRIKEELEKLGITVFMTAHQWQDTPLAERTHFANTKEREGYRGFFLSIHSNAVSEDNPNAEKIQGTSVWTTVGQSFSDAIAEVHLGNLRKTYPASLPDSYFRKETKDGDSDYEANLYVLRNVTCPAILEEGGFHTSAEDAERIIQMREARVQASVLTVLWVRDSYMHHGLA